MISKEAQTKKKKKNWLINFLTKDSQNNVIIGYSKNILSPAHIRVGPTHYKTHPHMSGRNYTHEISNKFPIERWKRWVRDPKLEKYTSNELNDKQARYMIDNKKWTGIKLR